MKQGKLFVFSAPSGSGKTTLVRHLLAQDIPLGFSISATSRQARGAEIEGTDYHFLSLSDFKQNIAKGAFVEYEEVYSGVFYGTLKSELEHLWKLGKHVLFDIDVKGGLRIKEQYPKQTLAIYVKPPSKEAIEERLRGRGTESEDAIKTRLNRADEELSFATRFDIIIINDDLDKAKKEVVRLVQAFINS